MNVIRYSFEKSKGGHLTQTTKKSLADCVIDAAKIVLEIRPHIKPLIGITIQGLLSIKDRADYSNMSVLITKEMSRISAASKEVIAERGEVSLDPKLLPLLNILTFLPELDKDELKKVEEFAKELHPLRGPLETHLRADLHILEGLSHGFSSMFMARFGEKQIIQHMQKWRSQSEEFKIFTGIHIPDKAITDSIGRFYADSGFSIEVSEDFGRIDAKKADEHIWISVTNSTPGEPKMLIMVTVTQI